MSKSASRTLLTILMYAGVALCLFPYFRGTVTTGILFVVLGMAVAVCCGMLRCYFMDGDCNDPEVRQTPTSAPHSQPTLSAGHKR